MKVRVSAVCDVGCVRENNEDMVLVGRELLRDDRFQATFTLGEVQPVFAVAVADGLGGANAGEVASRMVLEEFRDGIHRLVPGLSAEGLKAALSSLALATHLKVLREGMADPDKSGMGTTLIALLYYEGGLWSVNAGDSRLYLHRDRTLRQLSTDHSLRRLLGRAVPANVITNCFGGGNRFYVDVGPAGEGASPGDIYLLCSDGLSGMLGDLEIEELLNGEGYEDTLLAKARARGGNDNISYVIFEVTAPPPGSAR